MRCFSLHVDSWQLFAPMVRSFFLVRTRLVAPQCDGRFVRDRVVEAQKEDENLGKVRRDLVLMI